MNNAIVAPECESQETDTARETEAKRRTHRDSTPREAVLIVNTKARRGEEWFAQAQQALTADGIKITKAHALKDPSKLCEVTREAIKQGAKMIALGGGDGSFRSVAGILAHTDVVLGVLPLGTVNDFARNLGIEPDVNKACRVISQGEVETIDIGQANDDYFVITASLGFSAITQTALSPGLKKLFGPLGYIVAGVLAMHKLRGLRVKARCEELEEDWGSVVQAGAINGHSWMGGKIEIPGIDLDVAKLAFYAVPMQSKWAYLRMMRSLTHGQFFHTPGLRAITTKEIHVTTTKPQPLVLDGDLCGQTPVRIRVVPNALRVCVPPEFKRS